MDIKGLHYRTGEPVRLTVSEGRITKITPLPAGAEGCGTLPFIGPGLVDLQINGYGGYDFNAGEVRENELQGITEALWREGVTAYCPTVITNSPEAVEQAVRRLAEAAQKSRAGTLPYAGTRPSTCAGTGSCMAGIHLEGPFISPEDGPRGAHPLEHVRAPDWELFCRWQEAAQGAIRIVTLSPEWPGAADFISRCADSGVLVSIGHTSATPEQIREAVEAGARMSTHLGNGAHLVLPRHPNYIWEQLAEDRLRASVIADGVHLPPSVLRTVLRMKGSRTVVVSDAVSFSGMPPGQYTHHIGGQVVLTPEGRLHMAGSPGLLAGSVRMQAYQIGYLVRAGLCSLGEAWDMASVHASACLGLPSAEGLLPGAPADLALFRWTGDEVRIQAVYVGGDQVYAAGTWGIEAPGNEEAIG